MYIYINIYIYIYIYIYITLGIAECDTMICNYNGNCTLFINIYKCKCKKDFSGDWCSSEYKM